jgi:16S rRNA (guanine527-N7)-methyltransferase
VNMPNPTDRESPDAPDDEAVAREVFGQRFRLAREYHDLLAGQGLEWGLIGPREVHRLWDRHLLNSVAIADLIPQGADVVDVGTGAGLPGIPLAILRPDLSMTLLEPLLRRVTFLTHVVEELGIGAQVDVARGRAEEFEGSFDVVTARAVAPLKRLLPWILPLLGPRGVIIALKGDAAADEVATVDNFLRKNRLHAQVVGVRAHPRSEVTSAVRVRRFGVA